MSCVKRIICILSVAILLLSSAFSAYAAASPEIPDGGLIHGGSAEVKPDEKKPELGGSYTLNRLPDAYGMLKPTSQQLYDVMVNLSGRQVVVYVSEVDRRDKKDAILVLTPYDERASIVDDVSRTDTGIAYVEAKKCENDLSQLCEAVKPHAEEAGVTVPDCKVADIFDLTYYLIDPTWNKSDDHGTFSIKVGADKLKNFVCLLHRYNGEWIDVPDAKVTGELQDTLTFSATNFSPFAIIVWGQDGIGDGAKKSPKTGDNTFLWWGSASVGVLLIAAAAYVIISAARKREN